MRVFRYTVNTENELVLVHRATKEVENEKDLRRERPFWWCIVGRDPICFSELMIVVCVLLELSLLLREGCPCPGLGKKVLKRGPVLGL